MTVITVIIIEVYLIARFRCSVDALAGWKHSLLRVIQYMARSAQLFSPDPLLFDAQWARCTRRAAHGWWVLVCTDWGGWVAFLCRSGRGTVS